MALRRNTGFGQSHEITLYMRSWSFAVSDSVGNSEVRYRWIDLENTLIFDMVGITLINYIY